MGSRRLDPKIIRLNDRVRITVPKIVTRVGYPKSVKDYLPLAEEKYGAQLRKDIKWEWAVNKALQQIAYGLAKTDGFGGRERSLHFSEKPDLLGQEFTVAGIRTVQTGTYYPPHSSQTYYGEYDYDPGGLMDMKAHRLATGFGVFWSLYDGSQLEIPVEHLEKIS